MGFVIERQLWQNLYNEYLKQELNESTTYHVNSLENSFENVVQTSLEEGLLVEEGNGDLVRYRFHHDRIQQWLYEMIPEGRPRGKVHLRIVRLLNRKLKTLTGVEKKRLIYDYGSTKSRVQLCKKQRRANRNHSDLS